MLTSILPPVVHGDPQRTSRGLWLRLALLHSAGCAASAAAVGAVLAAAAWVVRLGFDPVPWAGGLAVAVVVLYLPRELGWTRIPLLLQCTRQVPRSWAFDYPRWATALLFGLGLGSGLYTRIVVPTFYVLLVWPFITSGFLWPVGIWCVYGLARSGHVWWLACTASGSNPMPQVGKITSALARRSARMHQVNALLVAAVAAGLLAWRCFG